MFECVIMVKYLRLDLGLNRGRMIWMERGSDGTKDDSRVYL